jgi:hypothetical protein
LKGSYGCICYLLFTAVLDDVLDIDTLDGFAKLMRELYLKPQGEDSEYFSGDTCKMEVRRLCYPPSTLVLNDFYSMLNA